MTDHADLIARMEEIANRPDCTYPGHMLDAAMVIKALVAERDEARALLREARGHLADHRQSGPARLVLARIDARLAKTEGTT